MSKIITTSQAQREIGKISKTIEQDSYIITNHGVGKMVILPYFDGCDENLRDYMEDHEMMQNREALQARYQTSSDSGESPLVV